MPFMPASPPRRHPSARLLVVLVLLAGGLLLRPAPGPAAVARPAPPGVPRPILSGYLKAANAGPADQFGGRIALDGDTLVVGATEEDSGATQVNGDGSDNSVTNAGAAYVFVRQGGIWSQQAYLKAANSERGDHFGTAVAIAGDTIVVGAFTEDSAATGVGGDGSDNSVTNAGAAYVFVRSGTTWSQQAYLKASNTGMGDFFGTSVAVAGDTVVVGANGEDSAATGVGGDQANNSAEFAGAAYVFTRSGTTWSPQAYLKASNTGTGDQFGASLAVAGDTVVVGAHGEDSAATGVGGDGSTNGAADAGAAYLFVRQGGVWSQQAYVKASNTGAGDVFGVAVAVDGETVVVSASGEDSAATGVGGDQTNNSAANAGAAYVFTRSGSVWSQQAYLKASNAEAADVFGISVALSGETVVVGAYLEDSAATSVNGDESDNSAQDAGAAYVFGRSGTVWSAQAYLKASNAEAADVFGYSVALSGETVVVGALYESSAATEVGGDQADNSAPNAGAVYGYLRVDDPTIVTLPLVLGP